MKTLILIFHLLVCIFEIWMLSDFYDAFLGYKNKGKKRNIFIVLCFALIIFAINSFNNTVLNLSVVPFMYFLLAVVGFSGNIYKKIFGTFIGTVVLMGTELIVVGALSVTSQQLIESSMMYEPSAIMLTVIVKIVTLMVFAVVKQFVAKEGTNMDGATFMLYMVLPLSSIGIMFSVAFCNIDFGNVTLAKSILQYFVFCLWQEMEQHFMPITDMQNFVWKEKLISVQFLCRKWSLKIIRRLIRQMISIWNYYIIQIIT